jgi:ATP-dependent protease ClpP protease subunit
MDTVEFNVYEDFEQKLADRFAAFMAGLTTPCTVLIDIESCGGYTEVLRDMEAIVTQKKTEGFIFVTNVEDYAYSCGMFLFLLGDVKMCADGARFMYHAAGFDVFDRLTSSDLREMITVLEAEDALTNRILAENTTVAPEMLEILKKNDNFLSKEDLIYLGFMEREYELI